MLIHPVKASEWQKIGQENKELLKSVGALPINDVFFPCWNTRHKIQLYYGSYGCFHEGQLVVTNRGNIPISKVNVGDKVWSFNELSRRSEWKPVTKVFIHENYRKCAEVTLNNGSKIAATLDHKFYFGGEWVPLAEILLIWDSVSGISATVPASHPQVLELADIASYRHIDLPVVYDLTVKDNSNFHLYCEGKQILVHNSGKSVFICQDLINKCLHDPYFKCFYGRKKWVDVRESCFDTLVSTIEEIGLQQYFRYSRADNSSMVVKCVNGNVFNPFGGSEPDSMKSIKDPSHIWCEEFDQFEDQSEERQGDFQLLFPRLRTTKALTQFIASFNTAPVFPTHWIMKYYFPHLYEGEDKPEFDFLKGIDTHYQFANFTDNYFIDQEEYDRSLRMSSGGNIRLYEAIAKGQWGVVDNKQPWLYNFDYHKHVRPVKLIPGFPIYCAFDFNVSPFACTIWQFSPNMGIKNSFIHCIDEIVGQNKIEATCDIIKSRYPSSIIFVNGDRSGQNEDLGRNQTLYQMIAARLNINPAKQLILHTQNLEHVDSWALMNAMFWHYPNLYINDTCREFIKDCQKAKSDPKSNKPYQLLKNREDYKMDAFDSGRYFFQDYFLEFAQKTYLNVMNKR